MTNVLTAAIWDQIRSNTSLSSQVPPWVNEIFQLSFEQVMRLPTLEKVSGLPSHLRNNIPARPLAEYSILDQSYLDFLAQQIEINARGDAWSSVLRNRLMALQGYVNKNLLDMSLYRGSQQFWLKLVAVSLEVVYWEADE